MSRTPEESFLSRWSRLKRQPTSGEPCDVEDGALSPDDAGGDAGMHVQMRARGEGGEAGEGVPGSSECAADADAAGDIPIRDFSQFDFEALDFQSDYTQFMGREVPQEVRNKALRKLWLSNPVLANMDGLDDYCEDYTDAAMVPLVGVKTAYRIGRGFLSDSEVAEWEALGRKDEAEDAIAAAGSEATDDDADADAQTALADADADEDAQTALADAAEGSAELVPADAFDDEGACAGAACAAVVKQEEQAALDAFDPKTAPDDSHATGDALDANDKAAT